VSRHEATYRQAFEVQTNSIIEDDKEVLELANTTSDMLIETIARWEVDVVLGLPCEGINRIIEALRQKRDSIRFIQVGHEEAAAFMACG
jgi:hypothetical protein